MVLFLFDFRHREDNFYQNVGRRTQIWRRRWESCLEHSQMHAHIHTHWRTLCLPGEVPILNVSYKPQTISPKFKVCLIRQWCTLSQETQRLLTKAGEGHFFAASYKNVDHTQSQRWSVLFDICMCRAVSELCCTRRSGMPTPTHSSSPTSWSRCR